MNIVVLTTLCFILTAIGTGLLIIILKRSNVLDIPNQRSSHVSSMPRGGGIAVLSALICFWIVDRHLSQQWVAGELFILITAALLGIVCFVDDLRGLSPYLKLLFQIIAVAAGLIILHDRGAIFQAWLPIWIDLTLTGLMWLWFINLFNFMDGIDGITAVQMISIGLGLSFLSVFGLLNSWVFIPSMLIVACALGFLIWNWAPAKVFMGDVGSVPLGYLIGWLLISVVVPRNSFGIELMTIVLLPAYYYADSTITIIRRFLCKKNIFQAHREHFYQFAVDRGLSHGQVCGAIILANSILFGAVLLCIEFNIAVSITIGLTVVTLLLFWMRGVFSKRSLTK